MFLIFLCLLFFCFIISLSFFHHLIPWGMVASDLLLSVMFVLLINYFLLRLLYAKHIINDCLYIIMHPIPNQRQQLKSLLIECADIKRSQGELALEIMLKKTDHLLVKKAVQLIVDRFSIEDINQMLMVDITIFDNKVRQAIAMLQFFIYSFIGLCSIIFFLLLIKNSMHSLELTDWGFWQAPISLIMSVFCILFFIVYPCKCKLDLFLKRHQDNHQLIILAVKQILKTKSARQIEFILSSF